MKAWFWKLHRWLALAFALPLLVVIGTGLVLSVEPWLVDGSIVPGTLGAAQLQAILDAQDPGGQATMLAYRSYDGTLSLGAGAPDWQPRSDGCSVGLEMEDFDSAITELKAKGVKFKMEPFPTPVCKMAFISDPDGNTICIHKRHAK